MWIYCLLIVIIFLDFGLEFLCNKKLTKDNRFKHFLDFVFKFRVISIVAIVLVSSLRAYTVGADIQVYFNEFESYKSLSFVDAKKLTRFELGYFSITYLLSKLNLSFRVVLILSSVFIAICFYAFINEFSPNKCMSLVLFICFGTFAQSLNLIRHLIALAFVLLGLILLNKNKILQSIILIILASLFHITSLIAILFILFKYLKPTWQLFAFSIMLVLIGVRIFPYVMQIVGLYTSIDFYNQYFIIERYAFISTPCLVENLYSIGLAILLFIFLFAKKWLKNLDETELKTYDYFLIIYMVVPLIRLAGFALKAQNLLNRLNVWFFFSLLILVPMFIKGLNFNKKWKVSVNVATYIVAFCYMYYYYAIQASNGVVPYLFYF